MNHGLNLLIPLQLILWSGQDDKLAGALVVARGIKPKGLAALLSWSSVYGRHAFVPCILLQQQALMSS